MRGMYTLGKPVVAVPVGATRTTTLPSGAVVEVQQNEQSGVVQISCQQQVFVVRLPDLLDACRVEDVGKITFRGGLVGSSDEAE